jgi:hypothetical protein
MVDHRHGRLDGTSMKGSIGTINTGIGTAMVDFQRQDGVSDKTGEEANMKSTHFVATLAILNALLLCFSNALTQAGEAKGGTSHRGGQASAHMSSKGQENTNAQWSADPERGWVRADERHDLNDQRHSTGKSNQKRGKQKGISPKGKAVNKSAQY